jgi:hypothetical protein
MLPRVTAGEFRWEEQVEGAAARYRLFFGTGAVSWRGFVDGLCEAAELREALSAVIAGSPHAAVYWETPGVTQASAGRAFEMVTVAAPGLVSQRAQPDAFAAQIGGAGESVRCFDNLGRDARLVVPCPLGAPGAYAHLARFVREGPREQVDALWRGVGAAMREWWATRPATPVWLSTSGGGVPWLHVRLDTRPKYYSYTPYRGG